MEYFKKTKFGKTLGMVAANYEQSLTVWEDFNLQFNPDFSPKEKDWMLENGYEEATRKEFNEFFIENKKQLDEFIKNL